MKRFTLLAAFTFLTLSIVVGQTRCDTISEEIAMFTEEMPESSISNDQLEEILNSSIDLNKYSVEDGVVIYINFIVNCRGEHFDYKVLKPVDDVLESEVLSVLQSNVMWSPGKHHDKEVDVLKIMQIRVDKGRLRIVEEKGKKSRRK